MPWDRFQYREFAGAHAVTQVEYAKMIRSMHRIIGWTFVGSIVFSPIGFWILRRGNKIYEYLTTPQSEHDDPQTNTVLEGTSTTNSLIMSFDDFTASSEDPDV
jgi:hypothetical protein